MNQREMEILKIEESFKDTLENELAKKQKQNKKVEIKDIKLVGELTGQDKVNAESSSKNVFLVDIQIKEIDANGRESIRKQKSCYLGNECIGAIIDGNQMLCKETLEKNQPDKMKAVKELLSSTLEQDIESNSMNDLQRKELAEVLTAHLGREVSEDEVEKMIEEMDKSEIEELKEEQKDKDEADLSEKQTEEIKVRGIQKADLNKLVDGKETLGKRLDLEEYDSLYVIYSDKVDEITPGEKRNNTTYSLVGMTKDGKARVLNDEFEMDKSVGNNASRETTKIREDNTATRDNEDLSIYTRKSNGMSIGCENDQGTVNMFLYQKTMGKNENVGIQIETPQTQVIPIETREVVGENKGENNVDNLQAEIVTHTKHGCEPDDVKDFDGNENTETHEHISKEYINRVIIDIHQYGEINKVFGIKEVRDKLLRELEENKDNLTIEQVVENVKQEMNEDAEILARKHKF